MQYTIKQVKESNIQPMEEWAFWNTISMVIILFASFKLVMKLKVQTYIVVYALDIS